MARREEVFQAKVLQKLFPKCPKEEREPPTPLSIIEKPAKKPALKRQGFHGTVKGDGETIAKAAHLGKRVYTVLPPPSDYKADAEGCVSESINGAEEPAESTSGSSDEPDEDGEHGGSRRRRRRRKKRSAHQEYTSHDIDARGGEPNEDQPTPGQRSTPIDGAAAAGGERLSRNRKRKLKKRRHKEKLLSLGLVPRATALEFTYQKEGDEKDGELERKEQDEDDGRRAAEVSHFLRSTMEIYTAEGKLHPNRPPLPSQLMENLLRSLADRTVLPSVLTQLHDLKGFLQQEPDRLGEALDKLCSTMSLSQDETTAVISLFRYWITDILPLQRDMKPGPSSTQPQDRQSD